MDMDSIRQNNADPTGSIFNNTDQDACAATTVSSVVNLFHVFGFARKIVFFFFSI